MTRPEKLTLAVAIIFGRRKDADGKDVQTLFINMARDRPTLWITGVRAAETSLVAVTRCVNTRLIGHLPGHTGKPDRLRTSDFTKVRTMEMERYRLEMFYLSWAMPQRVEEFAQCLHVIPMTGNWESDVQLDELGHIAFGKMPHNPALLSSVLMPYPRLVAV